MARSQRQMSEKNTNLNKQLALTALRDWCMDRIAWHSLAGDHDDAQAMTEEHMEMLMEVNPRKILWMSIERTATENNQESRKI